MQQDAGHRLTAREGLQPRGEHSPDHGMFLTKKPNALVPSTSNVQVTLSSLPVPPDRKSVV